MRIVRIFDVGHSRAICLPPTIATALNWKVGDYLVAEIFEKDIVLSKLDFPAHIIKRLSEKRARIHEKEQDLVDELKKGGKSD